MAVESPQEQDDNVAGGKSSSKPSQADRIISLVEQSGIVLFHDEHSNAYARLPVDGHLETWPCDSRLFRNWLSRALWLMDNKAANSEALNSALNVIRAKAVFESPEYALHNRVASPDGALWYDLSDEYWRAVRVTSQGWKVISQPPILFRRYRHQQPQLIPCARESSLTELLRFINIKDADQGMLLLVYLVSCLIPDIPHPVLVLHGPQGSAKTTAMRMLRRLVDPSITEVLTLHGDSAQLVQQLSHHWMPFIDNVSGLPRWVSDALCRAVTGDGFSKRQLYTDDDDIIYKFRRCPGLCGINIAAYQPDLLDRCIVIGLERISESERKTEQDLWGDFEELRPRLLSGMFTALSKAMAMRDSVMLPGSPRMADFAYWGYAIAEALGWTGEDFLRAYRENERLRNDQVLESSSVARAIVNLVQDKPEWEGSSSELMAELEECAEALRISTRMKEWPKSPSALSRRLNELGPNLAAVGIHIHRGRGAWKRNIQISKTRDALQGGNADTIGDGSDGIAEMPSSVKASVGAGYDGNDDNDGISPTLQGSEDREGNTVPSQHRENAVIPVIAVTPKVTQAKSTALATTGHDGICDGIDTPRDKPSPLFSSEVQRVLNRRRLPSDVPDWPPYYRELYEERAAIIEFDGGKSRACADMWAELLVKEMYEREHNNGDGSDSTCGKS